MKKRILLVLILCLLTGCGQQPAQPYTVQVEGVELTLDPTARTVTDGENVYTYRYDSMNLWLDYPDGSTVERSLQFTNVLTDGLYPEKGAYLHPRILTEADRAEAEQMPRVELIFMGGILLVVGAVNVAFPQIAWSRKGFRRLRGAQLGENDLGIYRILGGCVAVAGAVLLILGFVL